MVPAEEEEEEEEEEESAVNHQVTLSVEAAVKQPPRAGAGCCDGAVVHISKHRPLKMHADGVGSSPRKEMQNPGSD